MADGDGKDTKQNGTGTVDLSRIEAQIANVAAQVREVLAAKDTKADAADTTADKGDKVYTRAELRAAVSEGRITQDQADALHDEQLTKRITKTATTAATDAVNTAGRADHIKAEIARYKKVAPDIEVDGSDARKRAAAEFAYLTKTLGDPENLATELKALRTALGPIDALERAAAAKEQRGDTHAETGGSGADDGELADPVLKDIPPRLRSFYETQVTKGVYKGWDDPRLKKELDLARGKPRRVA